MFKMDENYCPTCESMLDGATATDGKTTQPQPGDITICAYCTEVLEFTNNMKFIKTDHTKLPFETQAVLVQMIEALMDERPKFH
jgi:hypothetical protein